MQDDLDEIMEALSEMEKNVNSMSFETNVEQDNISDYKGDSDEYLRRRIPKIRVLGVGGAGNNTVTYLNEIGIEHAETIAVNTDAQQLLNSRAHKKVLIGENICKGFGAGTDPSVGEAAALDSKDKIRKVLEGTDLLFVTCGLGGGTGSGATPVITEIARDMNILTVAVCTLPFSVEGRKKIEIAGEALKKIIQNANTTIVIPNDKLREILPKATLIDAFHAVDDILVTAIKGISDLTTKSGQVNLEFSDVKRILSVGGTAVIGIGEASMEDDNRAERAVFNALNHPLLDVPLETAKAALINITGGKDITLEETAQVIESVTKIIEADQEFVKWGIVFEDDMKGKLRTTIMLAGIELPYIDENGNLLYPVIRKITYKEDNIARIREQFNLEILE